MANRMDDDLVTDDLVENEIGVGWRRYAADTRIGGRCTDVGILQQQVDDGVDAMLHVARASWRLGDDIIEDLIEIGERGKCVAQPHKPCLAQTSRT